MKLSFKDILVLVNNHRFNESIKHLDTLIQEDKNNFDYYYLKAISHLNLNEFSKAIENFSYAINIKDNNYLFYHFRGVSYLKLNKIDKAVEDFNKVISLKSDFPDVYNNLGFLFYTNGQNELAIENFTKSIKFNKDHKQAISGLINALSHTENVKKNNSKIISAHNEINKINFHYSSIELINEQNIREFLNKANNVIDKDVKDLDFNITQIYRRHKNILNCKRHKKIFNTHDIIPKYCFGCYKIQIEPDNVVDLIKLYFLFDNISLQNNNIRKCMIEFRSNIQGNYKGLIYCNSLHESEFIQNQLTRILENNFNKKLSCKIKRGCTEYGMKYSKYDNLTDEAMIYKPEWKKYENLIDVKYPELMLDRIITPSIKGFSLNDVLVIRNWLAYARMIEDQTYKVVSDKIFNSKFIEKKLKLRIFS